MKEILLKLWPIVAIVVIGLLVLIDFKRIFKWILKIVFKKEII